MQFDINCDEKYEVNDDGGSGTDEVYNTKDKNIEQLQREDQFQTKLNLQQTTDKNRRKRWRDDITLDPDLVEPCRQHPNI